MFISEQLILGLVNVTEAAAINCYSMFGMGNNKLADKLAVDAMRIQLNKLNINGTVVIGEGERDDAPMLYIGEKVGTGNGPEVDIALDPLEGTTILAKGSNNALSVIAIANKNSFLHAPDVYMDKIAIGFNYKEQIIDLNNTIKENLNNIALAKNINISDLIVMILDRSRHEEMIAKIRETGARVKLISDGDIAAVISTTNPREKVDVYMGIGGAPEGVLAASALKTTGGQFCGKLVFTNEEQKTRATKMGIQDLNKQYYINDLVSSDSIFCATGVTTGMLNGVEISYNNIQTHSIVMNSINKTISFIEKYTLINSLS